MLPRDADHLIHSRLGDTAVPLLVSARAGAPVDSFALWLRGGSRVERPQELGVTHLVEHLLFRRLPDHEEDLHQEIARFGGVVNAATTREGLVIFGSVAPGRAADAIELVIANLAFTDWPDEVVAAEKGVVVQELRQALADPSDVAHDMLYHAVFGQDPLGRPVGGTPETVQAIPPWRVRCHAAEVVGRDRLAVGVVTAEEAEGLIARLADLPLPPAPTRPSPAGDAPPTHAMDFDALFPVQPQDYTTLVLGFAGVPMRSAERAAMDVVAELLGGSVGSVLYEELRVARGMVYELHGIHAPLEAAGTVRLVLGTDTQQAPQVAAIACQLVLGALESVAPARVEDAKRRVVGQCLLEYETSARAIEEIVRHNVIGGCRDWTYAGYLEAVAAVNAGTIERATRKLASDGLVCVDGTRRQRLLLSEGRA